MKALALESPACQIKKQDQNGHSVLFVSELLLKMEDAAHWSSVQEPNNGVNLRAPESRTSQVFKKARFVLGGVAGDGQLERQQKVVGGLEALPDGVDLVDEVLQADDALLT